MTGNNHHVRKCSRFSNLWTSRQILRIRTFSPAGNPINLGEWRMIKGGHLRKKILLLWKPEIGGAQMPPSTTSSDGPELASVCFIREREREANFCSVSQFWVPVFLCAKRHFAKKQKSQSQQSQSLELSTMFSHYSLGKVVMHVKTNLAEN